MLVKTLGDWQSGSSSRSLPLLLSKKSREKEAVHILLLQGEVEIKVSIDHPVGPQVSGFLRVSFLKSSEGTLHVENP